MTAGAEAVAAGFDFAAALMSARSGCVVDSTGRHDMVSLQNWAREAAGLLTSAGAGKNEPVLIPVSGRVTDIAAILGVITAGCVAVPIHRRAHVDTMLHVRTSTGARFTVDRHDTGTPRLRCEGPPPPERELLEGAAMITFTSGSTGQAKGVVLSLARISAKLDFIQDSLKMPVGAASFVPLQLTFSFGQWVTFLSLLRGGTVHLKERYSILEVGALLKREKIKYFAAVPTMLRMLPDEDLTNPDVTILTGGEAVTADLRARVFSIWQNARIASIYGLTETGTCDLFHFDRPGADPDDSLGLPPAPIEVATDPKTFELRIRTPFAMLGYLDMPSETTATLSEGWIRTGDMARIAPDGVVTLVGRLKELVNRGGNKVAPLEVEKVFANHPDVVAVLATGVPDSRLGEALHLLVLLKGLVIPDEAELVEWASHHIERFKLPDRIHFGTVLPLGQTGKADRSALRRLIEAGALT